MLTEALAYAAAGSLSGTVIVEEYVPGRNVTVELFMSGGEPGFLTVTEKRMADRRNFVINGHRCPADLPAAVRQRLKQEAARVSLAMEVRDGPVNLDFIITPHGVPVVLEAGARVGGNGFPALVKAMSDVDTVAAVVSLATGEPFDVRPKADRHALLHVLASPHRQPLRLTVADGADRARGMPGVAFAEFYLRPGQIVQPFTCSANKIGYVAVVGDDHAEARRILDLALAQIRIEFEAPVGVVQ
jgi:biotin carboxylase